MVVRSPSERSPALLAPPLAGIEAADGCRCAGDTQAARFGCLECGTSCCSDCAMPLESVAYCRSCATTLLGATTVLQLGSFELY